VRTDPHLNLERQKILYQGWKNYCLKIIPVIPVEASHLVKTGCAEPFYPSFRQFPQDKPITVTLVYITYCTGNQVDFK
jgi:hypothetical protein